jgi:hypothetical protein
MFTRDLIKHAAEFGRYLRNKQYEVTDTGAVLFSKAKALGSGTYFHDVNGRDEMTDSNLLPDAGLIYLLTSGLTNGTRFPVWHLSLFAANYTPVPGLVASSYPATASEIVSLSEGYTETTRPVWTPTAPTTPLVDNLANKAVFTIATASTLVINGAAMHSEATKGAITGNLISATRFSAARSLFNTDTFNLAYRVQLTST